MWSKFLSFIWPLQWVMQHIGKKEPLMTDEQVDAIINLIQPGDILASYESQRLTSLFIAGDYDHAAILASNGFVMEAVGDQWKRVGKQKINLGGVREVPLKKWLYAKDSVVVIRPLLDETVRKLAAARALYYKGYSYDYSFSSRDNRVYCSELVFLCYANEYPKFLVNESHDNILPITYYKHATQMHDMLVVYEARNH